MDDTMWHDLLVALALMLVLEGLMPFASPRGFRQMLVMAASMTDAFLRTLGLASMGLGVALLYLVN
jgi:uncharacterized protein YjeT (DUF2065 family)